ncbi:MAG: glycosyltransferase family 4 protein [Akkermansiaceae bacterium]|nr:glycosyltransferase family 4 protein [Verrucomicrobiales bacterium]
MKIAFLSLKDMRTDFWSGTPQAMVAALERQGAEVRLMGAVDGGAFWKSRVKHHFHRRLTGRTYLQNRDVSVLRTFGRWIETELAETPEVDFVLTPFTATIAGLKTSKPIALWHDATFASLLDYYPGYERTTLCGETLRSGDAAEQAAIQRTALLIYTSDWAARTAIEHYGADQRKVRVVPYGANLTDLPSEAALVRIILRRRLSPLRFLFIGGEWFRKGGDVAFQIVSELNRQGMPAELHAVGANPQGEAAASPFVFAHGRLNKSNPGEMETLRALFQSASFFLLPSLSDCTPIVFSEANAFGLPVLSTRTGGIPSLIRDGINGRLFDTPHLVEAVCQHVSRLAENPSEYAELCWNSYREYRHRLNWDASARHVLELMNNVLVERARMDLSPAMPSGETESPALAVR